MVCWFSSRSRTLKESLLLSRSSQSASRSSWRATGRTRLPSRAERVPWCWATQGSTWLRQWSPCERRNSNQTVSTSPGVSGPFQWGGAGKWRSRVAGRSRRCRVAHKTGRSATTSTRSKRGSVVFILPFYPSPPFPKTTPNTSEPQGAKKVAESTGRLLQRLGFLDALDSIAHPIEDVTHRALAGQVLLGVTLPSL